MSTKPDNITRLRETIARLNLEREAITDAPLSRGEVKARVADWRVEGKARGDAFLKHWVRESAAGAQLRDIFTLKADGHGNVDATGLMFALADPLALDAALSVIVDREIGEGPDAAGRAARLAEIDAELLRLGHKEEDIIEAAEAAGTPIDRRANADPTVVLRLRPEAL